MLNALNDSLCVKLYWHNRQVPSQESAVMVRLVSSCQNFRIGIPQIAKCNISFGSYYSCQSYEGIYGYTRQLGWSTWLLIIIKVLLQKFTSYCKSI